MGYTVSKTSGRKLVDDLSDIVPHKSYCRPWSPHTPNSISLQRQDKSAPLLYESKQLKEQFTGTELITGCSTQNWKDRFPAAQISSPTDSLLLPFLLYLRRSDWMQSLYTLNVSDTTSKFHTTIVFVIFHIQTNVHKLRFGMWMPQLRNKYYEHLQWFSSHLHQNDIERKFQHSHHVVTLHSTKIYLITSTMPLWGSLTYTIFQPSSKWR